MMVHHSVNDVAKVLIFVGLVLLFCGPLVVDCLYYFKRGGNDDYRTR